ncbi:MAG: DUF3307 domain-containing protein [Pseudomonadota bacterium]
MIETFAALLFAHVLADFVLQTDWIVRNKRKLHVLLLHGAIVLITLQASVGSVTAWPLIALAGAHVLIDAIKCRLPYTGFWPYMIDQAAHLLTLLFVMATFPTLWAEGAWAGQTWLPPVMVFLSGLVLAVRAGAFAIEFLMAPWSVKDDRADDQQGLKDGGKLIGILERGIVYILLMVGQPTAVGFLIAAKSVLRFDTAKGDQRMAEYVIIGTLASFGWAIVCGYATLALLSQLPPLGILPQTP